jgi:hypothetical protein
MQEQNYKNHTRLVTGFHFVTLVLMVVVLVSSIIGIIHSPSGSNLHFGMLLAVLSTATILAALYARSFALKAQDRAIRAEENLRYYAITGNLLDSKLTIQQVIALRFAHNNELVELAQRAVAENMSAKDIKQAIKDWKADHHRV